MTSLPIRSLAARSLLFAALAALFSCSSPSLDPNRFASQAADANRDESRLEKALHELCTEGAVEFCEKEARVLLENGRGTRAKVAAAIGCNAGRPSSCALQGDILLAEGAVDGANQILTPSCESKTAIDGVSCPGAGEAADLAGDSARALRLWKRGCQQGSLLSCFYEGKADRLANRVGESMPPLRKACDGHILGSCSELGVSLALDGKINAAAEKFAADCDLRSHRACRWLPILEQRKKQKDLDSVLDRDCRKNNSLEACYDAAVLQFLRKGGRQLALYRWKENCKAGHKMSCWESFTEENGLKPLSQMNPDLEKFCADGILVACYTRALNHADAGHREKAIPIWTDACAKGEAWSCYALSESELVAESERERSAGKACELGLKRACAESDPALAEMKVHRAAPGPIDFAASCTAGDAEACAYLGAKAEKESSSDKGPAEAKEYYRKACLASSTIGCEQLARLQKK